MRSHRRHRVLLAAGELDLRARFARELQSSGYAVELASDMKRALRLAADDHFRVAIVAPGTGSADLAMMLELRDPSNCLVANFHMRFGVARKSRGGRVHSKPGSRIRAPLNQEAGV